MPATPQPTPTNRTRTTGSHSPVAAFFDLDKTIIARSSTLAFSRPFFDQGLINRRSVLKSSYAQFLFLLTAADHDQVERMRRHVSSMCTGWNVEQVRSIVAETLHDIVDPLVFAEAAELIAGHKAQGHDVVIVSASGAEIVEPIGEMVGADYCVASTMGVEDGTYTGEIDFYCYGDAKADAVREIAESTGYDLSQCFAYSDSITDLPMLDAVGHPTAVNPDRTLRKTATTNGWPVLSFSTQISLRDRLPSTNVSQHLGNPKTIAAAAIAGVGAGVAGVATYALRRRRRP